MIINTNMKTYALIRTAGWALMSLVGLALCSQTARADGITTTTDTPTTLVGSFSFTTSYANYFDSETDFYPINFGELPGDSTTQDIFAGRYLWTEDPTSWEVWFISDSGGSPDDVYVDYGYNPYGDSLGYTLDPITGYYNNDPGNVGVYFSIYNLQDTGGYCGTFSGNFWFNVGSPLSSVPDNGATLVLLGISLVMLLGLQRLMPGWARRS